MAHAINVRSDEHYFTRERTVGVGDSRPDQGAPQLHVLP